MVERYLTIAPTITLNKIIPKHFNINSLVILSFIAPLIINIIAGIFKASMNANIIPSTNE